jgi:hypothetical protein
MGDPGGGGMGGGGGRGGRGGDMSGMDNMGGMQRQRVQSKPVQLAEKLKLNSEQKEEVQKILVDAVQKAMPLRQQMDKQRAAIATAMIQGKAGDEMEKLLADYSTSAGQMTALETDAFGKIYGVLKPNQQSKASQTFELMASIVRGPSRGGQGRGRGEGRQ